MKARFMLTATDFMRIKWSHLVLVGIIGATVALFTPKQATAQWEISCEDCDEDGDCVTVMLTGFSYCDGVGWWLFKPCLKGGDCMTIWCVILPVLCGLADNAVDDAGVGIDGHASPRLLATFASGERRVNEMTYLTDCSGNVIGRRYQPSHAAAVRQALSVVRV